MINTSPGPLTASWPTDVKMGAATLPTSSVLRTVCDGARHMAANSCKCRVALAYDGRRPIGRQPWLAIAGLGRRFRLQVELQDAGPIAAIAQEGVPRLL